MTDKPPIGPVLEVYGFPELPPWGGERPIRCVFHGDRHASASVNIDEGLFYCHMCGIAGDAYSIVISQEGGDFVSAKRRVQEITGFDGGEVPEGNGARRSLLPKRSGNQQRSHRLLSSRSGGRKR